MESKLSVEIGAQLTNLNSQFAKAVSTVTDGTQAMNDQIGKTERSFKLLNNTKFTFGANYASASKRLALEAQRAAAILGGSVKKGANEAGQALTNLGRIAQDAPFGFIGIQNNLNPLLESFGRLKAETGSTGSALKALGSSLIGPAGLGIALSVVSAAFLFYQQYARSAKSEVADLATANDMLSEAVKKGNAAAGKEISTLELLYNAATNVKNAQETRNKAALEVIRISDGVFKASDKEKLKNGELEGAYNTLTQSIIANARAKAIADKIGEQEAIILDAQINRKKIEIANLNENAKTKDVRYDLGMGQSAIYTTADQIAANNNRTKKELANQDAIIKAAQKAQNLLKSFTNDKALTDALAPTKPSKGGITENISDLRKELQALKDENYVKGLEMLQKSFEQLGNAAKGLNKGKLGTEPLISMDSILPKNMAKLVAQELQLVNFELIKFNDQASDIINGNLVETFSGIGDAIGDALSGGQNLLTGLSMTLLSSLGSVVTDLGRLAIATGVGIKAIRTAFKTLNPLVAIAAGVGLIALGSAITKSVSKLGEKIPGYANGTNSARGGIALVGERGPELVNLPTGSAVTPNHQIAGMLGGGNVFIPDMVLRGEDIWVSFRKVDKRFKGLG